MNRERGVQQTDEYGFRASAVGGGAVAITSNITLQLGVDRQQLPLGIRVGSFLCAVLKHVSIPGH